ncbi:MAG: hypothetical protein F4Y90_00840 [Rhodothermaceae bacterium]|nr:hypothetical protein [Rhodothermaceae bacterium]MYF41173.1 hypothetical protein [Rhodothermaceae bacterium]
MSQSSYTLLDLLIRRAIASREASSKEASSEEDEVTTKAKADLERQKAKTKEIEDRNKHRYKYAGQFMLISSLSLFFVAVLVVADGLTSVAFDLSDTVLIALLGTALSTVFAPTYLLAKYLFKHDEGGRGT